VRASLGRDLAVFVLVASSAGGARRVDASAAPDSAAVTVERLEAQAAARPLGIDDPAPRLSWVLASARRGVRQTAFEVRVASSPDLLRGGRADLWDSGRVASADPWTRYAGRPLASRTRYHWSVRAHLGDGTSSAWAEPSWFETAYLAAGEWRGRWIAGPERASVGSLAEGAADDAAIRAAGELCRPVGWLTRGFAAARNKNDQGECRELRPAPMLRKSFHIGKAVRRARVYASGLAYNALRINGRAVSDSVLDPGFTDYSRTVLYTAHDATALLRPGENVIATELGSGHFDDATRTWDWGWEKAQWRGVPRLRLDLRVELADGSEQVIASDESWKVSVAGPTRYDSFYLGETYDARREVAGWDAPGFDDSAWAAARVVDAPAGSLRAQVQEPIRVVSERSPAKRTEPAPGIVVYDTGQNLTGWAELRVRAPAGTAVEAFYSEKLGENGRASTLGNDLVFGQLQTDYYVAKGAGEERFAPRFSYKGFQYVQLSGPGGAPLPASAAVALERVLQVRTGLTAASSFESSSPTLDRIHRNTAWAVESNLHGVVTDTPVYEKNAWTGDAALTAGTASLLFDTERLYLKLQQDMRDAQSEAGELPLLCPSNVNYGYVGKPAFKPVDCCGATPAWDAFWFVVPWESYRRHGNREALAAAYPAMRKYLDEWIPRWTGKDGDAFAQTLTAGLGDWVPPAGVPTSNALVSSAYYAHLVRIAADVARAVGEAQDASRYERLFESVRADFVARFRGPDGSYRDKDADAFTQTAQVLPLAFGLVPDDAREALATRLADDVANAREGHPYVGVIGARHLLPVLTATGHHDLAVRLATQTTEPSWGYWTDALGFTALGEHWTADTRSRNHHFFGAIVEWLYEDLAGIRPASPGYGTVEFRPHVPSSGVDHVKASHESVRGTVATAWRRTPSGLELDVTVPAGAVGRVHVPAPGPASVTEIGEGRSVAAEAATGVRLVGVSGDRVLYDVGSGRYQFRVTTAPR
jgi:alpha-L-rhamnosidase